MVVRLVVPFPFELRISTKLKCASYCIVLLLMFVLCHSTGTMDDDIDMVNSPTKGTAGDPECEGYKWYVLRIGPVWVWVWMGCEVHSIVHYYL